MSAMGEWTMAKAAPPKTELIFSRGGLVALVGGALYFIEKTDLQHFKVTPQPTTGLVGDYFDRVRAANLLVPAAIVGAQFQIFDSAGVPKGKKPTPRKPRSAS